MMKLPGLWRYVCAIAAMCVSIACGAAQRQEQSDVLLMAMRVVSHALLVDVTYEFCREAARDAAAAVKDARDAWLSRHAALERKAIQIGNSALMDDQRAAAEKSARDHDAAVKVMREGSAAEQSQWCRDAPRRFTSEMNFVSRPALVESIMNYKLPQE